MVMYMSGMSAIPEDLYEAASLDGSSEINTFFNGNASVNLDKYQNNTDILHYQHD